MRIDKIVNIGGVEVHATRVDSNGGVFGHETKTCDEAGCAGNASFWGKHKLSYECSDESGTCVEIAASTPDEAALAYVRTGDWIGDDDSREPFVLDIRVDDSYIKIECTPISHSRSKARLA